MLKISGFVFLNNVLSVKKIVSLVPLSSYLVFVCSKIISESQKKSVSLVPHVSLFKRKIPKISANAQPIGMLSQIPLTPIAGTAERV